MKSIIVRSAIVLGLGIAPGAVLAQTQYEGQAGASTGAQTECPPGSECPGAGGAQMEGQAGATTEQPAEGQAGATAEGQAETTIKKPPEGQAGATTETETEGQAGATTEEPAEGQAATGTETQTEGQAGATTEEPAEGQAEAPAEEPTEGTAQTEQPEGEAETEGTAQTEQPADSQDETETGAIAPAEVTVEQKTEIKQVVQEVDVEPVAVDRIDFDIDVGVAVPRTIEVHPLPPRIVRIVPEYEGYLYFILADGRIVIVEPDTLKIVVIIV
jgi:hypothetical protein